VQARQMGGDVAGASGTSTAITATTMTDSGASWTASAFIGHLVATGTVYGVITANTTTALTIDRWYTPSSPGGAAASTPGTGNYVILPGNAPVWYMALTTDTTAEAATDTTLTSEYAVAGGGLIRKLAAYAHTTGVTSYTLTAAYTVNGSDTGLPRVIAKMGTFNSITGGNMQFEKLLPTTATMAAVGDQLTITQSITE